VHGHPGTAPGAQASPDSGRDIREVLREAIAGFSHSLPGQAPIRDFVHHNTLHGFQHLSFTEAVERARGLTGASAYLSGEDFRTLYRQGRITREDLCTVLDEATGLAAAETVASGPAEALSRRDVYLAALLHPVRPVTGCQLTWRVEELGALDALQGDVPAASRARLLAGSQVRGLATEAEAVRDLWQACLDRLGLSPVLLHPEELLDLATESPPADSAEGGTSRVQRQVLIEAHQLLDDLLGRVGVDLTLRGLLLTLTGEDILDPVRPLLLRQIASHLDQGLAAWHSPDRLRGLYAAWRESARRDPAWVLCDLPDWPDLIASMPDDPLDTVVTLLDRMGLPRERWVGYLERVALELPGWSGMVLWHHLRAGTGAARPAPVDMVDYLAVRLVLERAIAQRTAARHWRVEPRLDLLRWHLRRNGPETYVRHALFNARLPEHAASLAQRFADRAPTDPVGVDQWQQLAHLVWVWRRSPSGDRAPGYTLPGHAWPLFTLSQHLGLDGAAVRALDPAALREIFACLERLTPERVGYLWLQAYERRYREELLNALACNRARPSPTPAPPAQAQLVFCMDDREEGFRRHLEESDAAVQTFGAAGFFGLAMNWRGLDDDTVTPLCPIFVSPAHEVREVTLAGQDQAGLRHRRRRGWRLGLQDGLQQGSRRGLLGSAIVIALSAPSAIVLLASKLLDPRRVGRLARRLRERIDLAVPTRVTVTAADPAAPATPERPRLGFTDAEQADRVHGLLHAIGLTRDLAPLIVLMGHGSSSQNNPHRAAYDCGACSGRHGGPNARAFAVMANRPEVRALLHARGVEIPEGTWFLGAEHDTCDEGVHWFDLDRLPPTLHGALDRLRRAITAASLGSAHERIRRLASAPRNASPARALRHVQGRAADFSQVRPELGHATNAAAVIGRRSLTRGAFLDRRVFLISYDPANDPDGRVVETLLLAAGPVGAGISLEYYFSTVSNERYGCGSKVTHNVAGLFGVMDGASSDLRTGLPRQMIEIHEAMRLQLVVEARTEVLTAIYERQPALQELVGNGWVNLAAIDPETGAMAVFQPGEGFRPWGTPQRPLAVVPRSSDWYAGHSEPLPPALVRPPEVSRA
jgi:hypothetical protein